MRKITKDELLVKIATTLRLPQHDNIALASGETGYVYNTKMIQELLNEIAAFLRPVNKACLCCGYQEVASKGTWTCPRCGFNPLKFFGKEKKDCVEK